nr:MAG TPA: hypothetical protein [Caudoviricetes sp.]
MSLIGDKPTHAAKRKESSNGEALRVGAEQIK